MNWLVSLPAWGEAHVHKLIEHALPALLAALVHYPVPVRLLVHTDQPERVLEATTGLTVAVRPVPPGGDLYQRFGDCHREAIAWANEGDRVALLCADIVASRELFGACEDAFRVGKRAVVAAATRTLAPESPPIGASARDLLTWTMRHPHPMVQACFWGGASQTPWAVYFRQGENITLRGFHLHPVAVVKDRPLSFVGTLDIDLLDNYQRDEIHVVTDPDDMAMAELSPPGRPFRVMRSPMTVSTIAEWARTRARPLHWWLSMHRIVIAGNGATDDEALWNQVLERPENPLLAA